MSLSGKRILIAAALLAVFVTTASNASAAPAHIASGKGVQSAFDLITKDGAPGVQATVRNDFGQTRSFNSGVGDLSTGRPFPPNSKFRAGSITKSFVSTVVLQLVAEHRVQLDTLIEHYLPNVVTGNGNDGNKITVRQLLQHTSGLYDYLNDFNGNPEQFRHRGADPIELVRIALSHPPVFTPGAKPKWSYSNTNYILAGLLVERITGQSIQTEVINRIICPLGLHGTYLPQRGNEQLRAPHPRGYTLEDSHITDFTDFDPSIGGSAGAIVSTGRDLNRFYSALFDGQLLPPEELAEMQNTMPANLGPSGARYGLGLASVPLSCGGQFWGHGGGIPGFSTLSATTTDGRSATIAVNLYPVPAQVNRDMFAAMDTALCAH